jgi:hypothetical protein
MPTTVIHKYSTNEQKIALTIDDFYTPDWQAQDAHTPKSKWWLSDGPHIGMRVVREE